MKTLTITATDEPVIIRLADSTTGGTLIEKAFFAGETHDFIVEDGVLLEQIDALTPDPSDGLGLPTA